MCRLRRTQSSFRCTIPATALRRRTLFPREAHRSRPRRHPRRCLDLGGNRRTCAPRRAADGCRRLRRLAAHQAERRHDDRMGVLAARGSRRAAARVQFGLMLSKDVRVDAFHVNDIAGGAMPIKERTIVDIREEMARLALDERYTVTEVAERYGYSRPSVRLWRDRYREGGRAGLVDLSHAPHSCPHRTTSEIEELILAEREKFSWGSKKILRRLRDAHPEIELPGRSAVDALLRRRGLVATRRRSEEHTSELQSRQ